MLKRSEKGFGNTYVHRNENNHIICTSGLPSLVEKK